MASVNRKHPSLLRSLGPSSGINVPDYLSSISDNSEKVNHLHIPRQRNDEVTYCLVIVEDRLIKSVFTKMSMKRKCSQGYVK